MNDYRLDVYDTAGVQQYRVTDFLNLGYTRKVNAPGLVRIQLPGEHGLLSDIRDKWQIEVWRKPEGQAWAREITGIYRKGEWAQPDIVQGVLTAPGLLSMLGWRIVAWRAGTDNRSMFIGETAEDVTAYLVWSNAGAGATVAAGRLREGGITGLSSGALSSGGNVVDWYCAYDNLLVTLQELAKVGGGDFDLVKVTSTTYQQYWYAGQLGTDRTATVFFSMGLGNMANPKFTMDALDSASVAIAGGTGVGTSRLIQIEESADYNVTTHNIEVFVDASNVNDAPGLTARGNKKLAELKVENRFEFSVTQAPACLYGVHYFLGDKVSAINPFTLVQGTCKVEEVTVGVAPSVEDISVKMVAV